ncbi:poly(ADP-ribose) glycohydrolase [Mugil cephalus]|uniref:poly(ADP-ribose) glycohydrolase n=1 Tax=Mugil cephalus TaxID=48193 RepID=UPI001FB7A5EF|nr:poly(ADP-ribose) glycohydrolase [Mugil cephalus]
MKDETKKNQSSDVSKSQASSSSSSTSSSSSVKPSCNTAEEKKKPEWQQSSNDSRSQASSSSAEPCSSVDDRSKWKKKKEEQEQEQEVSSSCCELKDLKRLRDCYQNLGSLNVHPWHTILIHVQAFNQKFGIVPHEGQDVWSSDVVKMPCSRGGNPSSPQASRWQEISKHLKALASKRSASSDDVEKVIKKYNPNYKEQWKFDALKKFLKLEQKREKHFKELFPKIAALASKLPEHVMKPIPLLRRGHSATITMSQAQISCLLANAFFCTFPHRNTSKPGAEYGNYPSINFSSLFGQWTERKQEKLKAVLHYFDVVTDDKTAPSGLVTFHRRCLKDAPDWKSSKATLGKLCVTSKGKIEDEGEGMLQVDFASSRVGGGVLSSGLVQEEILFLINPELIVSRLFTEKLDDDECLFIRGSQRFSRYSGFSDGFTWDGAYEDVRVQRDDWSRLQREIVAIDALSYKHSRDQFNMNSITRELNKAFCGFKGRQGQTEPAVATGKWGCGAFHADPQLKALIQLMAAAQAHRDVAFFSYEDEHLERSLQKIHHLLVTKGTTLAELHSLLDKYCTDVNKHRGSHMDLFEFITKALRSSRSHL